MSPFGKRRMRMRRRRSLLLRIIIIILCWKAEYKYCWLIYLNLSCRKRLRLLESLSSCQIAVQTLSMLFFYDHFCIKTCVKFKNVFHVLGSSPLSKGPINKNTVITSLLSHNLWGQYDDIPWINAHCPITFELHCSMNSYFPAPSKERLDYSIGQLGLGGGCQVGLGGNCQGDLCLKLAISPVILPCICFYWCLKIFLVY